LDVFIQALARICREHLFEEKLLVAPTLRIGQQWADRAVFSCAGVINLVPITPISLALRAAGPIMAQKGLQFLSGHGMLAATACAWSAAGRKCDTDYLFSLHPDPGLIRSAADSLSELSHAGLQPEALSPESFVSTVKAGELTALVGCYRTILEEHKLLDKAGVFSLATGALKDDPDILGANALVLAGGNPDLDAPAALFIDTIPDDIKVRLPGEDTDLQSIVWSDGGPAAENGTGTTSAAFMAAGEANEVREVLRRCMVEGISFDDVEILHTDTETYVPLIYEIISARLPETSRGELCASFAEGVPAGITRPGKLLGHLVRWARDGWTTGGLAGMLSAGLFVLPENLDSIPFGRLASLLERFAPLGSRDTLLAAIARKTKAMERRLERRGRHDPANPGTSHAELEKDLRGAFVLRSFAEKLFNCLPPEWGSRDLSLAENLSSAIEVLKDMARCADSLDGFALGHIIERMEEMKRWAAALPGPQEQDPAEILARVPGSVPVAGSAPMPGMIHVAHILSGGHSGRSHTFIIGLDEGRFPGAGLQDPILLDVERRRLSGKLPLAADEGPEKMAGFFRLISRLRGRITVSFAARNLVQDREVLPSPVLLSLYRTLKDPASDLAGMLTSVPEASFAPPDPAAALDQGEWITSRLCGDKGIVDASGYLAAAYPFLSRGQKANAHRMSDIATAFDGILTEAGPELDPSRENGMVMSSTRLETLGTCPLRYFFRYVLGIDPPEEGPDSTMWLDNLEFGNLLHSVFYRFMNSLATEGLRPDFSRDESRILDILDSEIGYLEKDLPPESASSQTRDRTRLREAVRLFLREEEKFCRKHEPLYMEASIGLPGQGSGTALDTKEPVRIDLPGGRSLRAMGRIDRVDRMDTAGTAKFIVTDYKTGRDTRYRKPDPFWGGRVLQHALYLALAGSRLKDVVTSTAEVAAFRFLFPSGTALSETLTINPEELSRSGDLLANLCELSASGIFLPTSNKDDCRFCGYRMGLCGADPERTAGSSRSKLGNSNNTGLAAARALREKVR